MIHYIYLNLFRLYLLSLIWSFVRSFKKTQLKYCTKYFFFLSLFHLDLSFEEEKKLFFSFNHVKIHFTLFVSGGRFVHVSLLIIDFKNEIRNREYERKRTVWLVKKKINIFQVNNEAHIHSHIEGNTIISFYTLKCERKNYFFMFRFSNFRLSVEFVDFFFQLEIKVDFRYFFSFSFLCALAVDYILFVEHFIGLANAGILFFSLSLFLLLWLNTGTPICRCNEEYTHYTNVHR